VQISKDAKLTQRKMSNKRGLKGKLFNETNDAEVWNARFPRRDTAGLQLRLSVKSGS
jgi:hypothetical protein